MKLRQFEFHEFLTPPAKMEGKWWEIRKGYGLSQTNSYGEAVGRLFYGIKITADDGCEGFLFGRVPTGSYGAGNLEGNLLITEQDINDTGFFDRQRRSCMNTWDALKKYDPMNTEQIWHGLRSAGLDCSITEALWDLKARFAGLPLHQLVGGAGRTRVRAYASTFCDIGTPDQYAEHAMDCYKMGYRAYKIHPYRCLNPAIMKPAGGNTAFPHYDIEICQAVKAKIGDRMELMLDPDGIYKTEEDAIMVGRELKKLGFKWYEAPMDERENPEKYAMIRSESGVPMCGPENAPGGYKTRALWHQNGWTDTIRPEGGFIDIIKTMSYAQVCGSKCEVHGGGWIAINAIAAFPEDVVEYYEQLLVEPGQSEFTPTGIENNEPRFENGEIIVPMEPGVGYGKNYWPFVLENSLRSFTLRV